MEMATIDRTKRRRNSEIKKLLKEVSVVLITHHIFSVSSFFQAEKFSLNFLIDSHL